MTRQPVLETASSFLAPGSALAELDALSHQRPPDSFAHLRVTALSSIAHERPSASRNSGRASTLSREHLWRNPWAQ